MKRFRSRYARRVLVPVVALSLLSACSGWKVQEVAPSQTDSYGLREVGNGTYDGGCGVLDCIDCASQVFVTTTPLNRSQSSSSRRLPISISA